MAPNHRLYELLHDRWTQSSTVVPSGAAHTTDSASKSIASKLI